MESIQLSLFSADINMIRVCSVLYQENISFTVLSH